MNGVVVSTSKSEKTGVKKEPCPSVVLRENYGIEGDAHASEKWHRQVSLLAVESIAKMEELGIKANFGDFAENITTKGLELFTMPVGTHLAFGEVILEVTQIGKKCHHGCEIFKQVGKCIMPTEGIFTKVIKGGTISVGDDIRVL
ncbi:MAG: MOSC domain-containing protein [Deltaproteobacteria bacterium]